MKFIAYFRENFLTSPDRKKLPHRVLVAIHDRERANEILARIIQLTIVLLFTFIYIISPKTSPDEAFYPVPYVLGTYLIIATIGFIWALKKELPDWSIYCSILFDFALLYGLMISFHMQYMQPASFILKAPALLYVFIFIALRVLRLESKFVITAGAIAALGWFAVIFYVTRIDTGDNMLTRSYVEYLTSNSILIGAEVDKILSIVFVTAILALAVNGSANLLVTAVTEKSAAQALSRFFDTSVASGIRDSQEELVAGSGVKVNAAILNVDIRGFTKMAANMDASRVMEALSCYQSRIVPIIQSHGGIIDKFMGDGIMATFGTNGNVENGGSLCALSAFQAAEDILSDYQTWPDESGDLKEISKSGIGLGLAGGIIAHGAVGQSNRLEMTVIGTAVNLSAKLEKHNKTMGTIFLAGRNVYDMAKEQGYEGKLNTHFETSAIEGVPEPQEIVVLDFAEEKAKAS
ncbi:MAG: adenylate/guanylate cyclase domain-containing protein [Rhizobiaceae bacterium]|nr:adenylate/guanylate cyclase domain-containing protein [Rhizobiaceae bacterium]